MPVLSLQNREVMLTGSVNHWYRHVRRGKANGIWLDINFLGMQAFEKRQRAGNLVTHALGHPHRQIEPVGSHQLLW